MNTATAPDVMMHGNHDDAEYNAFLERIQARFLENIQHGTVPLFTTNATALFAAFLDTFPDPDVRQDHTCHACKTFIDRYGGLVTIDKQGHTAPAIWHEDDAPDQYRPAIAAMVRLVKKAKVTGVFLSSHNLWGEPVTGIWRHFAVTPPASIRFRQQTQTAGQAMAEKREDFKTVIAALNDFSLPVLEQAVTLLETDSLYRSEKVLGQARWLRNLHVVRNAAHGNLKANIVHRAIALAPAGFCHPRSSMIGTLLEDIAAGMDFSEVSRRFAAKMHPLQYQRPQAAPTAGAIAQAEKLVAQLGIERSLVRRFARLDDIETIWEPMTQQETPSSNGVFGHLTPKGAQPEPSTMTVPPVTITWEKFSRTVLPTAEQIELYIHPSRDNYTALVTASHADAPPILQWDRDDQRNPVSWYVWVGGSEPTRFGLMPGAWARVPALTFMPFMWRGGEYNHYSAGVVVVIDGAKETQQQGNAIFPECLRSELHGVRSVIEAYSRSAKIEGMEEPHVCGLMLRVGNKSPWNARLRVTTQGRHVEYLLDRWD